jgi:hypothetical protein
VAKARLLHKEPRKRGEWLGNEGVGVWDERRNRQRTIYQTLIRAEAMMPLKAEHMGKAYGALKSQLGRRACREGWGVGLFEFIAEHGAWPDPQQIDQLITHAAEIAEAKESWPAFARDAHTRRTERLGRIADGQD